jgi:Transcriptional Coactivator p15 (PC4)
VTTTLFERYGIAVNDYQLEALLTELTDEVGRMWDEAFTVSAEIECLRDELDDVGLDLQPHVVAAQAEDPTAATPVRSGGRDEQDTVLYRFAKNGTEEVRGSIQYYRGHKLAEIRVWVDDGTGTSTRTRKGLSVRVEQLPELRRTVEALLDAGD